MADSLPKILEPVYETEEQKTAVKEAVREPRDHVYLLSRGWRLFKKRPTKYGTINYWDHPNHQPDRNGFFCQQEALAHQQYLDRGGRCDCLITQEERI